MVTAALALGVASFAAAQSRGDPLAGGMTPNAAQTLCSAIGGGMRCNSGTAAQQYGSQAERIFGSGGASSFADRFAAARAGGNAAAAPTGRGRRHRITTFSDGTTATTTQYGRHSVVVYSNGRVERCQQFGAQRICR